MGKQNLIKTLILNESLYQIMCFSKNFPINELKRGMNSNANGLNFCSKDATKRTKNYW